MKRRTRSRIGALLIAVVLGSLLAAAPASAATQTKSYDVPFTGSTTKHILDAGPYVCDECIPDIFFDDPDRTGEEFGLGAEVHADVTLAWDAPSTDDISYNDTLLQQGQTLDVANTLTTKPGTIHVGLNVNGAFGIYENGGDAPNTLPDWTQTTATVHAGGEVAGTDIACALPLPGDSPRECSGPTESIDIVSVPVAPGVSIVLKVKYKFVITASSDGVLAVREASIVAGQSIPDASLTWDGSSPDTVHDLLAIGCTQPVGSELNYGPTSADANVSTKLSTVITPALGISLDLFPDPPDWDIVNIPIDLVSFPDMTMTAPDPASQVLGTVMKDSVAPVADAGGSGASHTYTGVEGTAVNFDGTDSSDNCPITLRWDYSDGGVAFGPTPSHVFTDNGHYTGLLTVTDQAGNTSTQNFEVNVTNVTPIANAGPDGSGAWGRPIAFNGAGTDPGASDQSTLVYSWDFGDGTPSATGGPSVTHAYATPNDYTATFTVCDKDGACDSDTRSVHVRKRATTTSYLGATSGTFDTSTSLSASLVDEFGQSVNSRSISFKVDGAPKGSANTSSSGIASLGYTPTEVAGSHTTDAAFAGDSFYEPSTSSGSIGITQKATSLTYTGALTGGANKTVTLSAVLVDATGTPLAGCTVTFVLGTQTVSATTNASGIASTSLKLDQKNGTYGLTATYVPAGTDVPRYLGSSASATFKLQSK